jgi:hypothetical protein
MKTIFLFIITLLSITLSASAQQDPTTALENKIEDYLHHIDKLRRSEGKFRDDSLQVVNAQLMTYLKRTCSRQSGLLLDEVRPTDSAGNPLTGMNILTSDDNKLRIYCWDTWTGKSQHSINALAQVAAKGNATRIKVLNDIAGGDDNGDHAGTYYTDICVVHTMLGKTVYLLMDHKAFGNRAGSHAVHSYEIDKGSLIPVPIFKTNGKLQNTVAVEHDLAPYGEWAEDDANIKLSDDKKTMFVPLLKKELPTLSRKDSADEAKKLASNANNDAALKGDYYIYRFDGFHFVYDKEANKGLKQQ